MLAWGKVLAPKACYLPARQVEQPCAHERRPRQPQFDCCRADGRVGEDPNRRRDVDAYRYRCRGIRPLRRAPGNPVPVGQPGSDTGIGLHILLSDPLQLTCHALPSGPWSERPLKPTRRGDCSAEPPTGNNHLILGLRREHAEQRCRRATTDSSGPDQSAAWRSRQRGRSEKTHVCAVDGAEHGVHGEVLRAWGCALNRTEPIPEPIVAAWTDSGVWIDVHTPLPIENKDIVVNRNRPADQQCRFDSRPSITKARVVTKERVLNTFEEDAVASAVANYIALDDHT